jgi:hypothetical protein
MSPWFLKIPVTVDSYFTDRIIEKLSAPNDSKCPSYSETDGPRRTFFLIPKLIDFTPK